MARGGLFKQYEAPADREYDGTRFMCVGSQVNFLEPRPQAYLSRLQYSRLDRHLAPPCTFHSVLQVRTPRAQVLVMVFSRAVAPLAHLRLGGRMSGCLLTEKLVEQMGVPESSAPPMRAL